MKLLMLSAIVAVAAAKQLPKSQATSSEVIMIGGSGDGITSQVITPSSNCMGKNASPRVPDASYSTQNGWSAGVFDADNEPKIMLCGGKDIQETDNCHILKVGGGKWEAEQGSESKCKMTKPRTHASMMTTFEGKVIISGGYSEQYGWLSDIEQLTAVRTENCEGYDCCDWESLGSFDGSGIYAHCSLQYDDETLVFIGGNTWSNEYGQYDVASINMLNIRTGAWTKGKDMPVGRQRLGCIKAEFGGRSGILVTGGYCHGNPDFEECNQLRPSSTIFYDFAADTWEDTGADLGQQRDGVTLANLEGTIFAFGGQHQGGAIQSIEYWEDGKWLSTGRNLGEGVAYYAAAIIHQNTYSC